MKVNCTRESNMRDNVNYENSHERNLRKKINKYSNKKPELN